VEDEDHLRQGIVKMLHMTGFEVFEIAEGSLRANMAETLLVPLIRVQGGKEIQHEKREDIFAGPVRRWH
jgi:hypothetical protein